MDERGPLAGDARRPTLDRLELCTGYEPEDALGVLVAERGLAARQRVEETAHRPHVRRDGVPLRALRRRDDVLGREIRVGPHRAPDAREIAVHLVLGETEVDE